MELSSGWSISVQIQAVAQCRKNKVEEIAGFLWETNCGQLHSLTAMSTAKHFCCVCHFPNLATNHVNLQVSNFGNIASCLQNHF